MSENKNKALGERDFLRLLASAEVILAHPKLLPESASLPDEDIKLEDLLIDSFTFIQIAIQLEDQLGLFLSPEQLQASKTLQGLFNLLGKTLDARR